MSNDSGNWLPYNLDGSLHECRDSTSSSTKKDKGAEDISSASKTQSTAKITLNLESLDQRIKKLEETFDRRFKKIEAVLFGGSK